VGREYIPVIKYEFLREDDKYAYFQLSFPRGPKTYLQVDRYLNSLANLYFSIAAHILKAEDIYQYLGENKKVVNALAFYWNSKTQDAFVDGIPAQWRPRCSFFILGYSPEIDDSLEDFVLKVDKKELIKEQNRKE